MINRTGRTRPAHTGGRGRSAPHPVWRIITQTATLALIHRATGLAAEAAFFAILSLPPLIFAGVGMLGYVANSMNPQVISSFQAELIDLASRILTPSAVDEIIGRTISSVLSRGRADVISIGFLIAFWSGSRALNTFIDAIGIMYGHPAHRNVIRARLLSFGLYVALLAAAVVLVPLVLAGPDLADLLLPRPIAWLSTLYWPVMLASSALLRAAGYDISPPRRHHQLRHSLPGAAIALIIWITGSYLLRLALNLSGKLILDLRTPGRTNRDPALALPHLTSHAPPGTSTAGRRTDD